MASMTFLQLVKAVWQESGLPGAAPSSVLDTTGRSYDVVRAVLEAHEEIQVMRSDWSFDWAQVTAALTADDDLYTPTAAPFSITGGVRAFVKAPGASYIYPTASGVNARNFLTFREWEQFRGINVPVATGSTPTIFTLKPDGDIQYFPRPSVACTVVHEYFRNPQSLAATADSSLGPLYPGVLDGTQTPRMPAKFHMAIVWGALMKLCGKTKDFSRFDTAEENYNALISTMVHECTPRMMVGGSLA